MIPGRTLTIERTGQDRYRRTLVMVFANGVNVSCAMVRVGHAA